jgi:signal transduction histidine kinase
MLFLAVGLNFILINMQKKNYQATLDAQGQILARMLADTINISVFTENKDEMLRPVKVLLLQDDVVEVLIWNKKGRMLLQENKNPSRISGINIKSKYTQTVLAELDIHNQLNTETKESFVYWSQVFIDFTSDPKEDWYFEDNRHYLERTAVGYVAIAVSKEFFKAGVRNILIQTGASLIIFLCTSILIIFLIMRKMTEPLRRLMQIIRKNRGTENAADDLTVLTETYDGMLEDLEKSFATIRQLNEGLEKQVAHRTILLTEANEELSRRKNKLEDTNTNLTAALSRLKETQDQLIQKEKLAAMGQVVAGVAHEINNTVNFISGALPSLHRCLDEVKEALCRYEEIDKAKAIKADLAYEETFDTIDQLMENIEEGTRRTTSIIRDLKTFSREDEEMPISLDLQALLDSTIKLIDINVLANVIIHRSNGLLPPVYCLPGRISQVFLNIMHNAIQAMDGSGDLTITTVYKKQCVHIVFSDTGCGIPSSDMAMIFDPFYTSKEVGKGTGLGLGISYSIVRQHGGVINVQSKVGEGSEFEVVLPVDFRDIPKEV